MNRQKNSTILLVDDEQNILTVLSSVLRQEGYTVLLAASAEESLERLHSASVDLVVTDLRLPGKSGLELLEELTSIQPGLPVIMITAFGSIENAVQAMKLGAFNYLTKPVNTDEFLLLIRKALDTSSLQAENLDLKKALKDNYRLGSMIGKSRAMQEVFTLVAKVTDLQSNILVTGETGTGKELVAKAIHFSGQFANQPFVTIDCASVPESLLESELFGHAKGAFTGAVQTRKGRIESADGGTLFLDEVGELPLQLQGKFLRFLQNKEFVRLGSNTNRRVNLRIVAATNKDLEAEVARGHWREDLFYRLNVINIHIPPLRERPEDIPLLMEAFLEKYAHQNHKPALGFSDEVAGVFDDYDWPGNVRELENVIERGVILSTGDRITRSCLPARLLKDRGPDEPNAGQNSSLLAVERELIVKALHRQNNNQSAAARDLGISRKQLRTKMKHHDLLA